VDGTSHDGHAAEMADMERDEKLKSLGFRTIRIPALDIKDNIDGVLFEIAAAFGSASR
jgi:very-short-patch-repair endonuclease